MTDDAQPAAPLVLDAAAIDAALPPPLRGQQAGAGNNIDQRLRCRGVFAQQPVDPAFEPARPASTVAFGAAPALIVYKWGLEPFGRWGWFAAFVHCAGAALRLARFNTNIDVVDKRFFQGMPSPAAAALVVGFVWLADDNKFPLDDYYLRYAGWCIAVYTGVTMVSSVPFYSFKDVGRFRRVPVVVIFLLAIAMFVISSYPPLTLFVLFVAYGFSGYLVWLWMRSRGKRAGDMLRKAPPAD